MNNCKKCGSDRVTHDEKIGGHYPGNYIVCLACGHQSGSFYSKDEALEDWESPTPGLTEYKTIQELRAMFEKDRSVTSMKRAPAGMYCSFITDNIWKGYLFCAKDNGLLPPDIDLLEESVK